jgi:intracellular sulfur oxidation DsrE/DsrF family protein
MKFARYMNRFFVPAGFIDSFFPASAFMDRGQRQGGSETEATQPAFPTLVFLLLILLPCSVVAEELVKPDETPELEEVLYITRQSEQPEGVLMHTREYDESAFYWVAPRLEYYVSLLREAHPALPLVILSHGDEMAALTTANNSKYREVQQIIRRLVETYDVDFQVCGRFAAINNLDESDFPDFVHMIPSAPTALADYRDLGYEIISIELTW